MSFASLKKNRSNNLSHLQKAAEAAVSGGKGGDDRYWKLTVNGEGIGAAVIRFMPAPEGEDLPWAKYWNHYFKGYGERANRTYYENSLTTIGKEDPVGELNSRLWNAGNDADKELARNHKRKTNYVTNILVINDPAKPENNGKVFLYRFGAKIFEKIMDTMNPAADELEEVLAVDVFDLWTGANFKLRQQKVAGWPNYDKAEFDKPSEVNEAQAEEAYGKLHSLKDFTDESKFKSYNELKARLVFVLGDEMVGGGSPTMANVKSLGKEEKSSYDEGEADETIIDSIIDEEDADTVSFFSSLADED